MSQRRVKSSLKAVSLLNGGQDHVTVYWTSQNQYSVLKVNNIPDYDENLILKKEDLVGKLFNFKWTDGLAYEGEIRDLGTKKEMLATEADLEAMAAELSFNVKDSSVDLPFYALVQWMSDFKHSVLKSQKLLYDLDIETHSELVGFIIKGNWKGTWLDVSIKATGTKEEMKSLLEPLKATKHAKLINDGPPADGELESNQDLAREAENQDNLEEQLVIVDEELNSSNLRDENNKLKEENASLKRKCTSLEAQIKRLRRLVKHTEAAQPEGPDVEIGGGYSISKSVDDFIKMSYRDAPMKFMKYLVLRGKIFTLEELASHSVRGGKSSRSPDIVRPQLDPTKLKAATDYTIKTLCLASDPYKLAKFESNLKDLCTNARKELRSTKRKENLDIPVNI